MTKLTAEVRRLLVRELKAFAREVELFPDDETLWRTLPGVTNSAGTLARHACGNLKHYIGAHLGRSGYVRDRAAEFASQEGTRAEVAHELRETSDVVRNTLPGVSDETLAAPFPEPVAGVTLPCDRFLLHLCTHLAFHLGEAAYLRRILTQDTASSGAVSIREIADV